MITGVNSQNYQEYALRTEAPMPKVIANLTGIPASPDSKPQEEFANNVRLLHAALGLTSDSAELLASKNRINTIEECGDLLWFCAVGAEGLGGNIFRSIGGTGGYYGDFELICQETDSIMKNLQVYAAEFSDLVKKKVFYGSEFVKGKSGPKINETLQRLLGRIVLSVAAYAQSYLDLTLDDIMQRNITKLEIRYPDKFTEAAAQNRDYEKEHAGIAAHDDQPPTGRQ